MKKNKYYLIYVDDNLETDIFEDICKKYELEPFFSTSVHETVDFINKNKSKIAVIFSDYKMPECNGFKFREEVIGIQKNIPFFIASGYIDQEMTLVGLELKISGFIQKPMHIEKIELVAKKEITQKIADLDEDSELLMSFIEEASANVETVEELALDLENDPEDMNAINKCFGIIHTIKGGSGFFEPKTLYKFAHSFEEILKKIQKKEMPVTAGVVSALFFGFDTIKVMLKELKTDTHTHHDNDALMEELSKKIEIKKQEVPSESKEAEKITKPIDTQKKQPDDIKVSVKAPGINLIVRHYHI